MGRTSPSEKIIGYCDKCRATLRVGRKTAPQNYTAAASSKGWRWVNHQSGQFVSLTCRKCVSAEKLSHQGTLAL